MYLLADELKTLIPIIAITGGVLVALVSIIAGAITRNTQVKAREETRREIAAYVAEGTISPEDAARLLGSGSKLDKIKQHLGQG